MDLALAVYNRMADDVTLTAMLAVYKGEPAVFTGPQVPEDAELPYIWSYGNIGDSDDGNKLEPGRDIFRDIGCYTVNNGDPYQVELIAHRIHQLFHRHELAIESALTIIAVASGPVVGETDDSVQGRTITIRLRIE